MTEGLRPASSSAASRPVMGAIVGARAHGQTEEILPRLKSLDKRHPKVAEINYQLAWTCDVLDRAKDALPYYEKAVALGLPPNELSGALLGFGSTLRNLANSIALPRCSVPAKPSFPTTPSSTSSWP